MRLELLAPVSPNAVCFRLKGLDDAGNQRAIGQLIDKGVAPLGPVRLNERSCIRACVTNYRIGEKDIDMVLEGPLRYTGRPCLARHASKGSKYGMRNSRRSMSAERG